MTLSETLLDLIQKYYSLGHTVKDTIIIGQGTAKPIVNLKINRAAVAWQIKDRNNDYDDRETEKFQERERERLADQVYRMTEVCLKGHTDEVTLRLQYGKHNMRGHADKMDFSVWILIQLEIISPSELKYLSDVQKDGVSFGMKIKSPAGKTMEQEAEQEYAKRQHET